MGRWSVTPGRLPWCPGPGPLRATRQVPVAIAVGWLAGAGVVLIAVTSALAARLR
jgi:hypothetical protein